METQHRLASARSCNRDTSVEKPSAQQGCSDIVNISVFFDGTGNNKEVDEPLSRWSNPARLWKSAQFLVDEDLPNYTIYVAGVGTPFNGTATDWIDEELIKFEDGTTGGFAGGGGARRTNYGQSNVNDQLRAALTKSAKKLDISIRPYIETGKPANLTGLARALEAHGLITVINLSIFGFSRGAALARAFSNDMLKDCVLGKDGVRRYHGARIRFHFMGLFDTVASFGLITFNIDSPFNERNLVVPEVVERCVHYIAAHELRFSFPVDLIRKDGKLKPGWIETAYPGVHSDVGGGYEPTVQNIGNNYARIPMRDMMREAARHGVRLLDYDEMSKIDKILFRSRFEIHPTVESTYKRYVAAMGTTSTVEQAIVAHMKALYAAWGTMTRRRMKTPDLIEAESRKDRAKGFGHPGIAGEAALLFYRAKQPSPGEVFSAANLAAINLHVSGMKYRMIVRPEKWRLDAWQETASEPILNFIRTCVHDSKAGFILSIEPFSYFRPRGMAESSRNVLARGLDWLDDTATAIKNGVIKIYHRVEGVVVETWEDGKLAATHIYRVGERFVIETVRAGVQFTVEVYQSGKQVLISTIKKGAQVVITSIDIAKEELDAAAKATYKASTRISEGLEDVGRSIQAGVKKADRAIDAGIKALEDGWEAMETAFGF